MLAILRRLRRDPLSSAVNIMGLAVALAAVLLMLLYVRFESSFDRFLPGAEHVWRLGTTVVQPGRASTPTGAVASQIAGLATTDVPGMEALTRASDGNSELTVGDRTLRASTTLVDPNFLDVLRYPVDSTADPASLLAPNSIILTRSLAAKLFDGMSAVGQVVTMRGREGKSRDLKVTALMPDPPRNSHLRFEALVAEAGRERSWAMQANEKPTVIDSLVYMRLTPGTEVTALTATLQERMNQLTGLSPDATFGYRLDLYRLDRLNLSGNDLLSEGATDPETLGLLTSIALLVLAVAIVNGTNLMTAQALRRGVEVGIRKTLGAGRGRLMREFMGEAIAITGLATLIAVALAEAARGHFADLVQEPDLSFGLLPWWEVAGLVGGTALLAGLLGGLYPALVMARWRPDDVFRGRGGPVGASWLRNALVVLQFAIATGLIVATVTVLKQVDHARDSTLTASPESLVALNTFAMRDPNPQPGRFPEWRNTPLGQMETLRTELLRHPGILAVTASNFIPGSPFGMAMQIKAPGSAELVPLLGVAADPEFLDVYGIPLLAGAGLKGRPRPDPQVVEPEEEAMRQRQDEGEGAPPPPATTLPAVLSAEGARRLGFSDPTSALGTIVTSENGHTNYEIVGIAADATLGNAKDPRQAVLYHMDATFGWPSLSIRLAAGDPRPLIEHIDATTRQVLGERGFHRQFLDEMLETTYQREIRQARIFAVFGGLAILLACFGLFAMTALAAARRTKEIGVRRVVGARVGDIVRLLVGEFARPVLLANLIAWPVAWWALNRWLEQYAVRIDQAPWLYLAAGAGVLLLAALTVGLHASRVALAPPARALRAD